LTRPGVKPSRAACSNTPRAIRHSFAIDRVRQRHAIGKRLDIVGFKQADDIPARLGGMRWHCFDDCRLSVWRGKRQSENEHLANYQAIHNESS
jgi:hypothetical protein